MSLLPVSKDDVAVCVAHTCTKWPPNLACASMARSRFTCSPALRSPSKSTSRWNMIGLPTRIRTEIGSIQRFVGQPYFEVTALLHLVELGDSQACSIDCYRITNVTVAQNRRRVGYRQSTPPCISVEGRDGAKMLDLDEPLSLGPCNERIERLARPVNMFWERSTYNKLPHLERTSRLKRSCRRRTRRMGVNSRHIHHHLLATGHYGSHTKATWIVYND